MPNDSVTVFDVLQQGNCVPLLQHIKHLQFTLTRCHIKSINSMMTIPLHTEFDDLLPSEKLRLAMRHWATGVAVVTSQFEHFRHGMTVNSFVSVSIDPPMVSVTMNLSTRTYALVQQSGAFAVTVLSEGQQPLAELFAGRVFSTGDQEVQDRFEGVDIFTMKTGAPLLTGGISFIDCRVVQEIPMHLSSMVIGEVVDARHTHVDPQGEHLSPLLYYNRAFAVLR